MIFTERTITVVNDSATINKPLILYRGDKNIELKITIAESQFKFRNTDASNVIETTDANYAQLVINTPYNSPIFSDVAATKNGAVIFVITEAMIDEIREVGAYEIQIRLLDDNKQSRASIPPVSNAIEIREPIAIEDGSVVDSNVVNVAKVNRALTTTSAPLEAFDSQGNYIKKTWGDGDPITDAALNKMEAGIDGVNKKVATGDAELIDSRIGVDGKVYENSGDAIRSQVKLIPVDNIVWNDGYYINTTSNAKNDVVGYKTTDFIEIKKGVKKIYIKDWLINQYVYNVVFYSTLNDFSSSSFITGVCSYSIDNFDGTILIPDGAKYFVLCKSDSNNVKLYYNKNDLLMYINENYLSKNDASLEYAKSDLKNVNGIITKDVYSKNRFDIENRFDGTINEDGSFTTKSYNLFYRTGFNYIGDFETVYIQKMTEGHYLKAKMAFYDENKKYIEGTYADIGTLNSTTPFSIKRHENAKYICFALQNDKNTYYNDLSISLSL